MEGSLERVLDQLGEKLTGRPNPERGPIVVYQHAAAWDLPSAEPACVVAQLLLRLCRVDHTVCSCDNDAMSPSGKLPFIRRFNGTMLGELGEIVTFAKKRGEDISAFLDEQQRAQLFAYWSLIESQLATALMFELWCTPANFHGVAVPLFGDRLYAWPLGRLLCWQRRTTARRAAAQGHARATPDEVLARAHNALIAFKDKLGEQDYLFGARPTELDAMLAGHLAVLIHCPWASSRLHALVTGTFPSLVRFTERLLAHAFAPSSTPDPAT